MKVYIVNKNADFTEGRGPMCLDKVFGTRQDAHDYVQDQPGIYGTQQYKEAYDYGRAANKVPVTSWNYNGYDIKEVNVETYDSVKRVKAQIATKKQLLNAAEAKFKEGELDKATLDALKSALKI